MYGCRQLLSNAVGCGMQADGTRNNRPPQERPPTPPQKRLKNEG